MDITDIKIANVRKILNTLRFSSGMTKRDIASDTGLSFSSVSNICNDLSDLGILYMQKDPFSTVGRTPDKYCFQTTKYCCVCIVMRQEDLWNLSVLDFANQVLFETDQTVSLEDGPASWLDFIGQTYQQLQRSEQFAGAAFVGAGIAVPQWRGPEEDGAPGTLDSLRRAAAERTGLPCYIQTPANLCAVSMYQTRTEIKNILYLYGAIRLGAGVICEGVPLHGQHGQAMEIFHLPLGDRDTLCPVCGKRGCIGADLSQAGMEALRDPALTRTDRARLIQDRGSRLGELLTLLVRLFDPGILYIGGLEQYEEILPGALSVLRRQIPGCAGSGLEIKVDSDSLTTIRRGISQIIYEDWYPLK